MKKMMKKKKILLAISILVIAIGTVIAATVGFKFDLAYDKTQKIELVIGKEFDSQDIKKIVKESTNGRENMIQKVEVYDDVVKIVTKTLTQDEKNNIIGKINEKYKTEIKADEVNIVNVPNNRGRNIVKPYILPLIISTVIIFIYIAIRYRKLNMLKIIAKTLFRIVLGEATLFGIIAIIRIPLGRLTMPMTLVIYLMILLACTTEYEEQLKEYLEEENKKSKKK